MEEGDYSSPRSLHAYRGLPSVGEVRTRQSSSEGGSVRPFQHCGGQARKHTAEFRQFLYQALGSLAEVETQLFLAQDLQYVGKADVARAELLIGELQKMIYALLARLPHVKERH